MIARTLVKELLGHPNTPPEEKKKIWPAPKIKSVLRKLSIEGAKVNAARQTVEVVETLSLSAIMLEISRTELSDSCSLSMCQEGKKIRLHVGGWTFEADAPIQP